MYESSSSMPSPSISSSSSYDSSISSSSSSYRPSYDTSSSSFDPAYALSSIRGTVCYHLLNLTLIQSRRGMTAPTFAGYFIRKPPSPSNVYPTQTIGSGDQRQSWLNLQKAASRARYTQSLWMSQGVSQQSLRKLAQLSAEGNLANSIIDRLRLKMPSNLSRQSFLVPKMRYLLTISATQGDSNCTVESLLYRKMRALFERSSNCLLMLLTSCRMSLLLMGIRSNQLYMPARCTKSALVLRRWRYLSFALSEAVSHRVTFPSYVGSPCRSSRTRRQSQGSRFQNFGLRLSIYFSAFSTYLQPRWRLMVYEQSQAPVVPELMNLKYYFLVIGVVSSYYWHLSWVILISNRWQCYSPSPYSLKELSRNFLLTACSLSTSSMLSTWFHIFFGKALYSFISSISSCNSTSTSRSLRYRSCCNSMPSATLILPLIAFSSSQTSSSPSLGFSRKRLIRLFSTLDYAYRASTRLRMQFLGQLMRSMRLRVVWMDAMVVLWPACNFSDSCPHNFTTFNLRISLLRSRPTSSASSSFSSTISSSRSVCLWVSSAMAISSKLSKSCFHVWKREQRRAMMGKLAWHLQQMTILFSFYSRWPVDVISLFSIDLLKYSTRFQPKRLTISHYFQSNQTYLVANLFISLRLTTIASFSYNFHYMMAADAFSRKEWQRLGRSIFLPRYAIPSLLYDRSSYMLSLDGAPQDMLSLAYPHIFQQNYSLSCHCWNSFLSSSVNDWLLESISSNFFINLLVYGSSLGDGSCTFLNFLFSIETSMASFSICMSGDAEVMSRRWLRMDALMVYLSLPFLLVFTLAYSQFLMFCFSLQVFLMVKSRIKLSKTDQNIFRFWSESVRWKIGAMASYYDYIIVFLALGLQIVRMADNILFISYGENFIQQKNSMRCLYASFTGKLLYACFHPYDVYSIFMSQDRSDAISLWLRVGDQFLFINSDNLDFIYRVPSLRMAFSKFSKLSLNLFSTLDYLFHSNLLFLLNVCTISSSSAGDMLSLSFISLLTRQYIISTALSTAHVSLALVQSKIFLKQQRSTQKELFAISLPMFYESFRLK